MSAGMTHERTYVYKRAVRQTRHVTACHDANERLRQSSKRPYGVVNSSVWSWRRCDRLSSPKYNAYNQRSDGGLYYCTVILFSVISATPCDDVAYPRVLRKNRPRRQWWCKYWTTSVTAARMFSCWCFVTTCMVSARRMCVIRRNLGDGLGYVLYIANDYVDLRELFIKRRRVFGHVPRWQLERASRPKFACRIQFVECYGRIDHFKLRRETPHSQPIDLSRLTAAAQAKGTYRRSRRTVSGLVKYFVITLNWTTRGDGLTCSIDDDFRVHATDDAFKFATRDELKTYAFSSAEHAHTAFRVGIAKTYRYGNIVNNVTSVHVAWLVAKR